MGLYIDWTSNADVLFLLKKLDKKMTATQEKIDALAVQLNKVKTEILAQIAALQEQIDQGETVDLSELAATVQSLDDLNTDAETA